MGIRCAAIAAGIVGVATITLGANAQCKVSESEVEAHVFEFDVDAEVEDGRLYAPMEVNGLQVIDVADPTAPSVIGVFQPEGLVHSAAVSGKIAYVIVRTSLDPLYELLIVDMKNPAKPGVLGSFAFEGFVRDIFVAGSAAFVIVDNSLVSIDVSNPSTPVVLGVLDDVVGFHAFVLEQMVYMTNLYAIRIVDIADPAQMSLVSLISTHAPGVRCYNDGIAVVGDYMYVGSRGFRSPWDGLDVYDVSDPAAPVHVGHAQTAAGLHTLAVHGDRAYAVTEDGEIAAFDISNPVNPKFLGARPMLGSGHSLAILGETLFSSSETTLFAYSIDAGCSPCFADTNDDGSLDAKDFDQWLNAYSERLCAADQNQNGAVESSDYVAWIANFNSGCDF